MSEFKHAHPGHNSLVWGARPCNEESDKYQIKPGLVGYEDLLCQLAVHFRDIDQRLESQPAGNEPDLSFEEQWTGRYDRIDPDGLSRKIYVKSFRYSSTVTTTMEIKIPYDIPEIRRITAIKGVFEDGVFCDPLPPGPDHAALFWTRYSESSIILVNARAGETYYMTLEYTKNES